jgi:hypothetical protein
MMIKNPKIKILILGPMAHGHNPVKVPIFKYKASIGNFILMINNHFALFKLAGNLLKTRKICSLFPWQHGIPNLFEIWNSDLQFFQSRFKFLSNFFAQILQDTNYGMNNLLNRAIRLFNSKISCYGVIPCQTSKNKTKMSPWVENFKIDIFRGFSI